MPFFIPIAVVFGGVYLMEQILGAGDKRKRFEKEYLEPRIHYPTKRVQTKSEKVENWFILSQWKLTYPNFGKDRTIWKKIHLEERIFPKEVRDIPNLDEITKPESPSKTWILSEYEAKTSPLSREVSESPILKAMSAPSTPITKED